MAGSPSEYNLKQLLLDATTRWLKPAEICEILNNHHQLTLSEASPVKPPSGSLFLFDRNKLRYFRKDGHNWRKKKDGRTVREAHEKLKAGNKDAIHCYYAHGEDNPSFQRRSYWLLEGGYENIVLVHYREVTETSPQPFDQNSGQVYLQMPSTRLSFGSTDYLTSSFISSPSEVVSSSYISQEGIVDVDSGDEFGDMSQAYQAPGLDSTACTDYVPHLVASGTVAPPSRSTGSAPLNTVVNHVSRFQHKLQFQTPASQDSYGQGSSNKDMEEDLEDSPWSTLLASTYSDGDNSENWAGLSQSQQSTTLGSHETWPFNIENQPDANYAAAIGHEFRRKPGVQHHMEPNVLLVNPSKQKQEVQTTNNGLLSPTVSLFMQSVQSDLTLGTTWRTIMNNQYAVPEASSLQGQTCSAPELLFSIVDFAPEWSYAFGKTKVLVIGVFLDSSRNYSSTRWACKFGEVEVPAEVLQPGILRCTTPPQKTGRVPFCVTSSDGVTYSNIKEFEFREKSSASVREEFECSDESFIGLRQLETDKQVTLQEQAMLHQIRLAKHLLAREDRVCAQGSSDDSVTSQKRNDKLDFLVVDDNSWSEIESLVRSDQHPYEDSKAMLGQTFFKSALHQWLQRKSNTESVASLDKHGLGVLHMAAALGYDWAIAPLLAAGVGVNFRDERGWTALHWSAFCGREKVIALLIAADAAPGALTDPTPNDPTGRTAADLAASSGHNGIAGYLGEAIVTSHFSSLNLSKLSAAMARDRAFESMSERSTFVDASLGTTDDELSLRDSLAAVRNATQAEACITATFRAYSFQRKREKEDSVFNEFGMLEEEARAFAAAAQPPSRSFLEKSNLAATQIQCKYKGWKVRSDFLSLRKHVVRIQAHVRGHQARKNYKNILWTVGILDKVILRWRRRGSGLRGYKADVIEDEDSDDDTYLIDFRKQKEAAFGEAVGRVKQMIQNPKARSQYRRMLEIYQKEKGAQLDEDFVFFDDEELMDLLGDVPHSQAQKLEV